MPHRVLQILHLLFFSYSAPAPRLLSLRMKNKTRKIETCAFLSVIEKVIFFMHHLESTLILAELDFTARFVAAVLYLQVCVFVHVLE